MIVLSLFELIGLISSVFLVFIIFIFFDFRSRCHHCKSRISEPICKVEIFEQETQKGIKVHLIKQKSAYV
jgi:hypothetical protein